MRCFVAVAAGPSIREALARELPGLQAAAEQCGLRASWARPESWHVTLKFLGELGEPGFDGGAAPQVAAVTERLGGVASAHEPFVAEALGVTAFPEGARVPNVVAVSLLDHEQLARLAADVDDSLAGVGFEREQRRFHAHVTFARIRAPRGWRCFARALAPLARAPFGAMEVGEMALYRSVLGNGPAQYQVLESFALGAPARAAAGAVGRGEPN